jgi:hypothetical protein
MKPIDPSSIVPGVDLSAHVVPPTRKLRPVSYEDIMLAPSIDGHSVCSMREALFSMWTLPKCHVCSNSRKVCATAEYTDLKFNTPCPCAPVAAMVGRLSRARIPWAYYYVSQSYLGQVGQSYVRDYESKRIGLRFVGPTGRGKTHRMLCVVHGLCERGFSARYVPWSLWLDEMRQAMGRENDMHQLRQRIESPDIVALDDIGRERATDWAQSEIDQLLERRTQNGGRTVLIASNLTDEQIESHLGDRLWSRIKQQTEAFTMAGKDWRAKKVQRITTMWPQVRMGGGKPCPECGSRTAERSQRVTASDLDERHQWWLTRHSCEGCGWAQDELSQGVSDEH